MDRDFEKILAEAKAERAQAKERHQQEIQAGTIDLIEQYRKAGFVKPCRNCEQDQWIGLLVSLHGIAAKDSVPEERGGVFGAMMGLLPELHAARVMNCLVLTCRNCANMQFFDMGYALSLAKESLTEASVDNAAK
jgi:hypothetical protein